MDDSEDDDIFEGTYRRRILDVQEETERPESTRNIPAEKKLDMRRINVPKVLRNLNHKLKLSRMAQKEETSNRNLNKEEGIKHKAVGKSVTAGGKNVTSGGNNQRAGNVNLNKAPSSIAKNTKTPYKPNQKQSISNNNANNSDVSHNDNNNGMNTSHGRSNEGNSTHSNNNNKETSQLDTRKLEERIRKLEIAQRKNSMNSSQKKKDAKEDGSTVISNTEIQELLKTVDKLSSCLEEVIITN
jgi:hypothetical protein